MLRAGKAAFIAAIILVISVFCTPVFAGGENGDLILSGHISWNQGSSKELQTTSTFVSNQDVNGKLSVGYHLIGEQSDQYLILPGGTINVFPIQGQIYVSSIAVSTSVNPAMATFQWSSPEPGPEMYLFRYRNESKAMVVNTTTKVLLALPSNGKIVTLEPGDWYNTDLAVGDQLMVASDTAKGVIAWNDNHQ